jgi:branched-chain amino acid aminotransferase
VKVEQLQREEAQHARKLARARRRRSRARQCGDEAGVHEAIMLNLDGEVAECTGDNIFFIRGSRIVTPPVSAGILNGVTRLFVMNEIAPACGIDVQERSMRLEDLFTADEVFLTGTAAEIIGVSSIDGEQIGEGKVGPITRRLNAEFRARIAQGAPEN